jgi:two-component system, response regulator PdtaR
MQHGDARDDGWAVLRGLCVLIAEDGWQLAEAMQLLLEKMGLVVAGPVATARQAQAVARERRPDVAVVDVNLNGEMAYPLMDWLHARGIPVIVITGYEEVAPSAERFAAILHKPFTTAALAAALQRAAAARRH